MQLSWCHVPVSLLGEKELLAPHRNQGGHKEKLLTCTCHHASQQAAICLGRASPRILSDDNLQQLTVSWNVDFRSCRILKSWAVNCTNPSS